MNTHCELRDISTAGSRMLGVVLFLTLGYLDSCLGETTAAYKPQDTPKENDDKAGMIKGMAAGFGGFVGIIILICILWCCCCGNDDSQSRCCCKKEKPSDKNCPPGRKMAPDRRKIGPSPPQSASSWSRSQ